MIASDSAADKKVSFLKTNFLLNLTRDYKG